MRFVIGGKWWRKVLVPGQVFLSLLDRQLEREREREGEEGEGSGRIYSWIVSAR